MCINSYIFRPSRVSFNRFNSTRVFRYCSRFIEFVESKTRCGKSYPRGISIPVRSYRWRSACRKLVPPRVYYKTNLARCAYGTVYDFDANKNDRYFLYFLSCLYYYVRSCARAPETLNSILMPRRIPWQDNM